MKNNKTPFNLNPVSKKFVQLDESLTPLNDYIHPTYNSLVTNKLEYYKTMFPPFYEIFKHLHVYVKNTYFRNNHRIFIFWIAQLCLKYDPNEVFNLFNDMPYYTKKDQIETIEELLSEYDCKSITKRKLKSFKKSQLKVLTKQIDALKTSFVKDIMKKKNPMQIELKSMNSIIFGSNNIDKVKPIIGAWACNGYELKDKYLLPVVSGSESPTHLYFYILQKNNNRIPISIN